MKNRTYASASLLTLTLSCGGEAGPAGAAGAAGAMGAMGAMGTMGVKGDPGPAGPIAMAGVCPEGYTDQKDAKFTICKKGTDEVVRVGAGATAFWIDRYEASVFSTLGAGGTQYGATVDDYPSTFAKNGQYTAPLYATSETGLTPSRNLTWFQADAACRANGKRLPQRGEWLAAARGTSDPGNNAGNGGLCRTGAGATDARKAGEGTLCVSAWGAQDLIGNLLEWTDEWYAGLGQVDMSHQPYPQASADYGNDGTSNIAGKAVAGPGAPVAGTPAAALRGGGWNDGVRAGVFALNLDIGPSAWGSIIGFRCVVPR